MAETKQQFEAKKLVNFELTELGKKTKKIFLPQNRHGDRLIDINVGELPDYLAEEMLKRKDGKGALYVKAKASAKKKPEVPAK